MYHENCNFFKKIILMFCKEEEFKINGNTIVGSKKYIRNKLELEMEEAKEHLDSLGKELYESTEKIGPIRIKEIINEVDEINKTVDIILNYLSRCK
jgi:hypothetical protein